MASTDLCKGCGQPIRGNYLTALGKTWHPEHFICGACRRPITDSRFLQHQESAYHTGCVQSRIVPRCALCSKSLTDEHLVDYWGTRFCSEHDGQYPKCLFCGRLAIPHEQLRKSNSSIGTRCSVCQSSAVEVMPQAAPLFASCFEWVRSEGLVYNPERPFKLDLTSGLQCFRRTRESGEGHALGTTSLTTYSCFGHSIRNEPIRIRILRGLPSTLFLGVLAHELGHVWLILNGVTAVQQWATEGFCELLAYRLYAKIKTVHSKYYARSIERNPDPVYGEGFRRVHSLAESIGGSGCVGEVGRRLALQPMARAP